MAKTEDGWKVVPHGLLKQLTSRVWSANAATSLPFGDSTRRMTVVALAGARVLIHAPFALREAELGKLELIGEPTYLVVPNQDYLPNALAWKARYPALKLVADSDTLLRLQASTSDAISLHEVHEQGVRLSTVAGTQREVAMLVQDGAEHVLVVSELVFNLPRARGVRGTLMQLLGFGPGVVIPRLVKLRSVRNRDELGAHLREWAQLRGLTWLIMSHGEPLENPRQALLSLAGALDGEQSVPMLRATRPTPIT